MISFLAAQFFGSVDKPPGISTYGNFDATGGGLIFFLNNILKLAVVIAGIFTLINFITAGYAFFSAGGDSKKIAEATAKIWQSIIGLLIVAGSFLLAAVVGWLIFGNPGAIIKPTIYTP